MYCHSSRLLSFCFQRRNAYDVVTNVSHMASDTSRLENCQYFCAIVSKRHSNTLLDFLLSPFVFTLPQWNCCIRNYLNISNHKLHMTNVKRSKNTLKKYNILMEHSCTVKYTVSEYILKVSDVFFVLEIIYWQWLVAHLQFIEGS